MDQYVLLIYIHHTFIQLKSKDVLTKFLITLYSTYYLTVSSHIEYMFPP